MYYTELLPNDLMTITYRGNLYFSALVSDVRLHRGELDYSDTSAPYSYVEAVIDLIEFFPNATAYEGRAPIAKPIADDLCQPGEILRVFRAGEVVFQEERKYR